METPYWGFHAYRPRVQFNANICVILIYARASLSARAIFQDSRAFSFVPSLFIKLLGLLLGSSPSPQSCRGVIHYLHNASMGEGGPLI